MKRLRRIAVAAASIAAGAAMPFSGFAGAFPETVFAADPETHTVKSGTKDGFMYTYSTIDSTKKGSIQIYKYEENNGKLKEGTGFKDDSAAKNEDGTSKRPIQGVEFKGIKIADVVNVAGNDTVGTYYTNLNRIFTDLLTHYGLSSVPETKTFTGNDADKNGKYYTTKSIENALTQLNEAPVPANSNDGATNEKPGHKGTEETLSGLQAVNNAVNESNKAISFGYTDKDGYAKCENLELGLYLIAETDYRPASILNSTKTGSSKAKYSASGENVTGDDSQNHQDVEVSTTPYLVSVPMTNVADFTDDSQNTVKKGTVWFYDVTTYPKNQTQNIVKKIIDPDTKDDRQLEDYEDYSIGDISKKVIYADAPANMKLSGTSTDNNESGTSSRADQKPNRYTIYAISDEMQKGLQFDGVTKVVIGPKKTREKEADFDGMTELKEGTDYRVITEPVSVDPKTYKTFDENQNAMDQAVNSAKTPFTGTGSSSSASGQKFCVQFLSEGIKKLNALETDSQVAVFFDTQVTADAKIGTEDKNTNQAKLTTKHEWTSTFEKYSNETREFTYEISAKKTAETDSDGSALPDDFHPEKTAFTVKQTKHDGDGWATKDRTRAAATNINLSNDVTVSGQDTDWDDTDFVRFIREEAGVYHVYVSKDDKEADATTIVNPASDGKLILKGLDSAKYTVSERETQDNYGLQKASFDVDLTADAQTDKTDYRSASALSRQAENALATEHVNGAIRTAKATADGTSTNLTLNDDNKGIVNLLIVNDKVVTLRTGGKGVVGIYIAAAGTGAAAAAAYVIRKRKSKKTSE